MTQAISRPLSGIRVIGLEQYMAGPYCTMLLADAGAEVVKIERPGKGDPRRGIPPFARKDDRKKAAGYMAYNRNKKSLALNVAAPEGQEILRKLAAVSDVVVRLNDNPTCDSLHRTISIPTKRLTRSMRAKLRNGSS